jgi:hypothetical protein
VALGHACSTIKERAIDVMVLLAPPLSRLACICRRQARFRPDFVISVLGAYNRAIDCGPAGQGPHGAMTSRG